MALNSFVSNQGTQTAILTDNTGGTAGTVIAVQKVDISPQGTAGTIWNGNVGVTTGTITTLPNIPGGTITNLVSGTINSATAVVNSATISVLPNLPQGSINVTAGTIATLGTMGTLGLVNTVTTVSNITNGSIVMTLGTVAAHAITAATIVEGTLRNLISGTINAATAVLNSGTINVGTFVMPSGTVTVLPNLPQGSINITAGTIATLGTMGTLGLVNTITTVSNLTNGSIVMTAGTINTGTVRLNPSPTIVSNTYGTTTNGTIGTLVAAPSAGSAIVVTSLDVNVQSGTAEPVVSWGLAAQGNQVLNRGNYVAGGGISKSMASPISGSATGTALTFNVLSGAGTISYNVGYFIVVP